MPKTEVGRAKSLLRKINKELNTIPDYDFTPSSLKMGTGSAPLVKAMKNSVTALRRGLRAASGKESEASLKLRRRRVKDLIEETKELTDGNIGYGGKATESQTLTNQTKAQVIADGNKRRREMK